MAETGQVKQVEVVDNAEEMALGSRERKVLAGLLAEAEKSGSEVSVVSAEYISEKACSAEMVESEVAGHDMRAPLEVAGVTAQRLAAVLWAGLNARKHVVVRGTPKTMPDHALRLKFAELAHKLRGDFKAEQSSSDSMTYEQRLRMVMKRAAKPVDAANNTARPTTCAIPATSGKAVENE